MHASYERRIQPHTDILTVLEEKIAKTRRKMSFQRSEMHTNYTEFENKENFLFVFTRGLVSLTTKWSLTED
jgi:hypothetical protein